MADFENTKDWVVFIAKLAVAVDKSAENGQPDLADLLNFVTVVPAFFSAIDTAPSFADLTESEQAKISAVFKDELDLKNDDVERIAEMGFDAVVKLLKYFAEFRKAKA